MSSREKIEFMKCPSLTIIKHTNIYLLQCDQIRQFFCTLGNFLKPLAKINLPKSLTFLGNFCKVVKMYDFSSEIIFGQLL